MCYNFSMETEKNTEKDEVADASESFEKKDPLTSHPSGSSVVEVSSPSAPMAVESDDDRGFWDMLEEAGVSKKSVVMIILVFLGIIGVVFFLLFWRFGGSDSGTTTSIVEVVDVSESENSEVVIPSDFNQIFALSGLVNSYIFGTEFSAARGVLPGLALNPVSYGGSTVGVDSAISAGTSEMSGKEALVARINLLREIENARKVDLYEYLNKFVDRRQALQDHLEILNGLVLRAESEKTVVSQEMSSINSSYDASSEQKSKYEMSFFESLNSLYGETAYNNLELFIEASQKQIKEKAYYNSLVKINELLNSAISALSPRIRDISVNADALIKGVKVFEVHGSNIDAIIIQNQSK